jgi:hypothetical protein
MTKTQGVMSLRFRYKCNCGHTGRWLVNPNDAESAGDAHVHGNPMSENSKRCVLGNQYNVENNAGGVYS